jgi:hypothetical protein
VEALPDGDGASWAPASSFERKLRGPPVPVLVRDDQWLRPPPLCEVGVDMGASSLRSVLIRMFGVALVGGETDRVRSVSEG